MNVIYGGIVMLNFQNLNISEIKQQKRIEAAENALGEQTIRRMLAFSSYLMGFQRQDIAENFNYTIPGLASMIKRIQNEGTVAFSKSQGPKKDNIPFLEQPRAIVTPKTTNSIEATVKRELLTIKVNNPITLDIPFHVEHAADQLFIIKCYEAGMFTIQQTGKILQKTSNQIQTMKKKLKQTGGLAAVQDQRQGQQRAYKFPAEAQSELFYCLVEDLIVHRSISSIRIHDKLTKNLGFSISDRMVRNYLESFGLSSIRADLIKLAKKKILSS
jgi:transposase